MKRIIHFIFICAALTSLHAQQTFLTAIPSESSLLASIKADSLIRPQSATASNSQSGEGIERSYDGSMTTLYHSSYTSTTFPVTLDYKFSSAVDKIDYLIYYPRTSGTNGNFMEVEIWYAANGQATLQKYGDYNFQGVSTPSTVTFQPALVKPTTIRFVVKSGKGDSGNGFASCAEMEFYRKSPDAFDWTTIFTDATCSELKPGVTQSDIDAISSGFYKKLASDILHGFYVPEFRVQSYRSYRTPAAWASENKTAQFGIFDGATGIYAKAGEPLILIVGETSGASLSLFVKRDQDVSRTTFALKEGINKVTPSHDGLVYVGYYTATGTEAPVKINFVTGYVNGYFDKNKHTDADWTRLINAATYPYFDLKGDYATLNVTTSVVKAQATDARGGGRALINVYDDCVYRELEFEGFVKYNRMPPTRLHFQVGPSGINPNATDYRVLFPAGDEASVCNVTNTGIMKETTNHDGGVAWMLAHEAGHVLQVRPGFKWVNMTEVTINLNSQLVTIAWGLKSRLKYEPINGSNRYAKARTDIINNADPSLNFVSNDDPFCRLVPLWQIKLYMENTLEMTDFYKDFYQKVITNPDPVADSYGSTSHAIAQMECVKLMCETAGLDLTSFFEKWRFFTVTDVSIEDYSTSRFTLTQQTVNAYKQAIAAMNLPKPNLPTGKDLINIEDDNWSSYKK